MEELKQAILVDWKVSGVFVAVLCCMATFDMILGTLVAFVKRTASSTVSREGVARKVAIFMLVSACLIVDAVIPKFPFPAIKYGDVIVLSDSVTLAALVCVFYISTEVISLLEKLVALGVKTPRFLRRSLIKVRDTISEIDKDESRNRSRSDS